MAHTIEGTYTIRQVLSFTKQTEFKNRYKYAKRDKIYGSVRIKKIKYFDPDRLKAPIVKYEVTTTSVPHYPPYRYKQQGGKNAGRTRQRNIKHQYDITFETGRLSIDEKNWVIRLGSGKTWKYPPQSKIKSIYRKTRKRWNEDQIKKHKRKKNLYLDVGDYNARYQGINGDFLFRCAYVYKKYGHLYGRQYGKAAIQKLTEKNPREIMFFPKHLIVFIELLIQAGILGEN